MASLFQQMEQMQELVYYICKFVSGGAFMLASGMLFILAGAQADNVGDKVYGATFGALCLINSILYTIASFFPAACVLCLQRII